jgi:hypothetical protein
VRRLVAAHTNFDEPLEYDIKDVADVTLIENDVALG